MDTLQYVYSSSESSDELESAMTTISPKEIFSASSSSKILETKTTADNYFRGHGGSRSPSSEGDRGASRGKTSSAETARKQSPDQYRKEHRRSSDRRSPLSSNRRSPLHYSHKERRRSRDRDRKQDRDRDRRHRDRSRTRRKDRSRDRRHSYNRRSRSRSPRRSYRNDSPKRSKDRSRSPPYFPQRKHFDPKNKLAILTKMGIDYMGTESVDSMPNRNHAFGGAGGSNSAHSGSSADGSSINSPIVPNYYNPLTINAGKYADQIAKRKLLWNNKKKEEESDTSKTGSVWQGAKFLQDSDGKMTAKFQRLMGIKEPADSAKVAEKGQELIKKQEELFSTMEMQYEVARATTHTQRGVGLGFGPRHVP